MGILQGARTAQNLEDYKFLHGLGLTRAQIAEKMKISISAVQRYAVKARTPAEPPRPTATAVTNAQKLKTYKSLRAQGKTDKQIAEAMNVTTRSVRRYRDWAAAGK